MELVVVTLIVMALAAVYVTRFFTQGKFPLVEMPREAFVRRWGVYVDEPDKTMPICRTTDPRDDDKRRTNLAMRSLAYLAECDWCQGFWWSCAITATVVAAGASVPLPFLTPFALAAVVGISAELLPSADKK